MNEQEIKDEIEQELIEKHLMSEFFIYKSGFKVTIENYITNQVKDTLIENMVGSLMSDLKEYNHNLVKVNYNKVVSPLCIDRQNRIYYTSNGQVNEKYSPFEPELWKNGGGLFHRNCRHYVVAYFEGISSPIEKETISKKEQNDLYEKQQQANYLRRNKKKWYKKKVDAKFLENDKYDYYKKKHKEWVAREKRFLKEYPNLRE